VENREEVMEYLRAVARNRTLRAEVRVASIQAMATISLRDMLGDKLETIIECLNKPKMRW